MSQKVQFLEVVACFLQNQCFFYIILKEAATKDPDEWRKNIFFKDLL